MWTSRVMREFAAFASLMVVGLALANMMFLLLSLIPLFAVMISMSVGGPSDISLTRRDGEVTAWSGDEQPLGAELNVEDGIGFVTVCDSVPEHFKLTEGNNLRVFWKGLRPLREEMGYSVECTRRGGYDIGDAEVETTHFSGLQQPTVTRDDAVTHLTVRQRTVNLRKLRGTRLLSRIPMPLGSVSKMGTLTDDFKDIREYQHGDQFKNINWKATVRHQTSSDQTPLVNDFEREGRKTVWLMVDTSDVMAAGSSVDNALENAVGAATSLAQIYLQWNCRVGLCLHTRGTVLLPDTGRRQRALIGRTLFEAMVAPRRTDLAKMGHSLRGHLVGESPLFIVLTTVDEGNVDSLMDGVREIRRSSGRRTKVVIVHVNPNLLSARDDAERAAAAMMNMSIKPTLRRLAGSGACVVPWDPSREDVTRLVTMGMRGDVL